MPDSLVNTIPAIARGVVEDGHWRVGIGDPTTTGWVTVAAYATGAILCGLAAAKAARRREAGASTAQHALFWTVLAGLLILLGINKQLDLQTWFWLEGRQLAREEGWYASRQIVQIAFILLLAAGGAALVAFFWRLVRNAARQHLLALGGIVFVTTFVLIRAASFHHIDTMLGWHAVNLNINALLELPGILCVSASAAHALRK